MPQQPKKKPVDPRRRMVGAVVRALGHAAESIVVKAGVGYTQKLMARDPDAELVQTFDADVFERWADEDECRTFGLSWARVQRNIKKGNAAWIRSHDRARVARQPKVSPPKPANDGLASDGMTQEWARKHADVVAPALENRHKLALLSVKGGCDVYSHALAMELREVEAAAPVGKLYVLIMPAAGHFARERPYFAAIPTAAGLAWAEASS